MVVLTVGGVVAMFLDEPLSSIGSMPVKRDYAILETNVHEPRMAIARDRRRAWRV